MAVVNLPIPAENATIARGQIYQLTGLTEATRYKFIVTSTKCPHVVIAKDEALEQLEAEGYLSGRAFYFATEGGQTNAYLRIDALEGAEITLTMKADQIPAPEEATLPADLSPDKWYSIGDLVADTGYELKVSAEVPVTVFVKTGDTIADAIEEPPFVTAAGTTRFTSTGTKAWVYVDGAVKANVDIVAAQGIEGFTAPQLTTLSDTVSDVALVGPTPAGYYRVDFVTEATAPEFQYDGNITIQNQSVVLTNVVGEEGAQGLLPLTAALGIVTGKNLRGTLIFSQGTALGAGQRAAVASFQIPTGGDASTFKGTAVITFVGNIA